MFNFPHQQNNSRIDSKSIGSRKVIEGFSYIHIIGKTKTKIKKINIKFTFQVRNVVGEVGWDGGLKDYSISISQTLSLDCLEFETLDFDLGLGFGTWI